jgi:hypothetical protein
MDLHIHIHMCPEHIQIVSYGWMNAAVTSAIAVINSDGSYFSSRLVTACSYVLWIAHQRHLFGGNVGRDWLHLVR